MFHKIGRFAHFGEIGESPDKIIFYCQHNKTDSSRRSDHGGVGQCGVSALQVGSKFGGGTRHHLAVLAELFPELKLDRTIVEIREKAIAESLLLLLWPFLFLGSCEFDCVAKTNIIKIHHSKF
jgi:hypothetical protein